jgi:GntR family transcriptional regulator
MSSRARSRGQSAGSRPAEPRAWQLVYARVRTYTALLGGNGYVTIMGGMIRRDGPVAPWRQIAQIFRDRIATGELTPGDRLPSIRSISQEYEVATTTAQKVLEALRDEGLVVTSPMGTFVAERTSS